MAHWPRERRKRDNRKDALPRRPVGVVEGNWSMQHTVLFVDDDAEILELFRQMLRHESFAVEVARCADKAFDVLASQTVSVIVADESMPGMSGTELLARVQLEHPDSIRVMVTGHTSAEVAIRAINEGHVYRFLTKPVRTAALLSTLRDAIAYWELNREQSSSTPTVQRRISEIAQLESEWRGLTRVERDASGAIVVDETSEDLAQVLREMESAATDRSGRGRT
jgi:two-component system, probable response regulator PhcQ